MRRFWRGSWCTNPQSDRCSRRRSRRRHGVHVVQAAVRVAIPHRAGVGPQSAGQHVQQRGLAGPGLAHDGQHFPGPEVDVHAAQGGDGPEGKVQVAGGQEGVGGGHHYKLPLPLREGDGARAGAVGSRTSDPSPQPGSALRLKPARGGILIGRIGARVPRRTARGAVIRVGTHEQPSAAIVDHHLVQIGVRRPAQPACMRSADRAERVIVEIQRLHLRVGRHSVDPLFPPGAEQLQRRHHVQLGIVERRDRAGRHQVASVHHHRIVVADRHLAEAGDVLIQLHVHQAVIRQRVHPPRFRSAWFQAVQRLRLRHLIDDDLVVTQPGFRNAVTGLDQRRLGGVRGGAHAGGAGEEAADGHGVGGVVRPLVDHLQHVVGAEHRGRNLDSAGAPAVGQRHLARSERHLVAGYRHCLQQRSADHAFGLLVQVGEVVALHRDSPDAPVAFARGGLSGSIRSDARAASRRMRRTFSSSLWKST